MKLASAAPSQPAPPDHQRHPGAPRSGGDLQRRGGEAPTLPRPRPARRRPATEMPPQPANLGTGNGILGVLPASSVPAASRPQAAGLCGLRRHAPSRKPSSRTRAIKPAAAGAHTGWIIQVGALESESEARAAHRSRPQSGARPARQGRSVHRAGRRQGRRKAVPRPLRRPRARSGRSGMPDAEARRHFLHHRSQLIPSRSDLKSQSRRHKRRLCCFSAHSPRWRSTLFDAATPSPVPFANFSSRIYG